MKKKYDGMVVPQAESRYAPSLWGSCRIAYRMPFGRARRDALMAVIAEFHTSNLPFRVNKKNCPLLRYDNDLRYLMKKGYLVQSRDVCTKRTSYSTLVPGKPYSYK